MSDPAIVDLVTFFEDVPPSDAQASASTPAFDAITPASWTTASVPPHSPNKQHLLRLTLTTRSASMPTTMPFGTFPLWGYGEVIGFCDVC